MVKSIDISNLYMVAQFMADSVPEWWTAKSAADQLQGSIGWFLDDGTKIYGWISCLDMPGYKTLEVDTCGYNDGFSVRIGPGLEPLFAVAENWARGHNYVNMRYIRTSSGLSCHGKKQDEVWRDLRDLEAIEPGTSFDWLKLQGFRPCGILPDVYEEGMHGIVMIKRLERIT